MATITQRHWKTTQGVERAAWIISYTTAGKRHIRTFRSKREAEEWCIETLHKEAGDERLVPESEDDESLARIPTVPLTMRLSQDLVSRIDTYRSRLPIRFRRSEIIEILLSKALSNRGG